MLSLQNVGMLSAVEFDHQPPVEADEIQKISPERRLPAEMIATLSQAAQTRPEATLLQRHRFA